MKSKDFLNENIVMDAQEMHQDHEVQMAREELYHAAENAIALHKLLRHVSETQGLEGWVSSKITLAGDYLKTVREYLEYELMTLASPSPNVADNTQLPIAESQSVAEGIKGEIAGGTLGALVGGAAMGPNPIGTTIGSALGGAAGSAIGGRWEYGKPLKEKQQIDEIAPLLAAGARLFIAAAPKIAQVVGKAGQAGVRGAGQAAKAGAEIAAKNAGQIGVGVGAYEIGSTVADIAKEITSKMGNALDQKTVLELANVAFKFAIPAGVVLAVLYGGKKAIDSLFDKSTTRQGVAEGLTEARNSLFAFVKQHFPSWPDYVLKDFLYPQAKGIRDQAELDDFLKRNKQDFGNCKWTLTKLPITFDIFTPKTQRMLASREGGSSNPFQVPRDAERHALQSQMIQQKGVSAEPIIVAKLSNGYDLIEGWHRTIQHLKAFPQGYTGPAWVCTGATYKSESVEQGVAEATGDPQFDKMLKAITNKKAVAKQQKTDAKQQARDAFGGMFGGNNPADKLGIRKKDVKENASAGASGAGSVATVVKGGKGKTNLLGGPEYKGHNPFKKLGKKK